MKSIERFSGTGDHGYPGMKDWSVFQTDVRTVSYNGYTGKIQFVAGGPPCQPFSLGGKHQAYNDARDMFPEAVRAVRETRPQAFPDDYLFSASWTESMRQIGNAVPVKLAKAVGDSVITQMKGLVNSNG